MNGISPMRFAAELTAGNANSAPQANDMFLKLLSTQLQNQSPLDPINPNEFASQLVQFNMLDQLIQIRSLLGQAVSSAADIQNSPTQGVK